VLDEEQRALLALSDRGGELCLLPGMANRHGLIAGATGTGKTVTLQSMAETFSSLGVPVFAADIKGDLSGVAAAGGNKESVRKRVREWGLAEKGFAFQAFPVQFWDVFGASGIPARATVAAMGPLLLGRLLELNDIQTAVLTLVFKIAENESLELVDLKDLRKLLEYAGNNAARYAPAYGNISMTSVGAIQRGILGLEHEGATTFFGEPALAVDALLRTESGKGVINILASERLIDSPRVYAAFLVWIMTNLFEHLPEVGDPRKPELVFFFDEAHLLFTGAPRALVEKVERVVRLIRSKGVGIYFISQSPSDIPDSILGQLGNRVQHALRAFTPKDQKTVRAVAETFRVNPGLDVAGAVTELGIGEALISLLDNKGTPSPVERAFVLPPQGQIGPLDAGARASVIRNSPLHRFYGTGRDRPSAFEKLQGVETDKERAAREKAEQKTLKEAEKNRLARDKLEQREAARRTRFWGWLVRSVVAPVIRGIVSSLLRGGRR
jgi:DNA helicase HerA-like ATPase